jgi:geranylgeranyl transferase type-2 subunit alpha
VKREHDLTADAINEKQREEALQVARWKDLLGRLAQISPDADPEGYLEVNSQVLLENPDYYPCWNARKRFLLDRFLDSDEAALKALIKKELDFDVSTIKRNPKSYFAWYHRRWLLQEAAVLKLERPVDPTHELALCTILLSLDQRNCT